MTDEKALGQTVRDHGLDVVCSDGLAFGIEALNRLETDLVKTAQETTATLMGALIGALRDAQDGTPINNAPQTVQALATLCGAETA